MDIKSIASALATQLSQIGGGRVNPTTASPAAQNGEIMVARVLSVTPFPPSTASITQASFAPTTASLPTQAAPAQAAQSAAVQVGNPTTQPSLSNSPALPSSASINSTPISPAPGSFVATNPAPAPTTVSHSATGTGASPEIANSATPALASSASATTSRLAQAAYTAVSQTTLTASIPSAAAISHPASPALPATATGARVLVELQLPTTSTSGAPANTRLQVISDRQIAVGEQLVIRTNSAGELRLLGATHAAPVKLATLTDTQLREQLHPLPALNQAQNTRRAAISEGLASTLNAASEQHLPMRSLSSLIQVVNSLPQPQRQALLSARLDELLQRVLNAASSSQQVSQAPTLISALRTSGTSFEAQLNQALKVGADSQQLTQLVNRDQKALLLQARAAAQIEITQFINQAPPANVLQILQHKPALEGSVGQLLAGLFNLRAQGPQAQVSNETRAQLLSHVKHLATLGIAKVQLQQALSLMGRTETETASQQPLQFEVNVRHGADLQPLQIQLYREEITEQAQADSSARETASRKIWCVLLTLNLAQLGEVNIELKLDNRQLHTKFWCQDAASLDTLNAAQPRLEALFANEELELKQLDILLGEPPVKKMSVNYNLVDVKT